MANVLRQRGAEAHREECQVVTAAEMGARHPQVNERQGLPPEARRGVEGTPWSLQRETPLTS